MKRVLLFSLVILFLFVVTACRLSRNEPTHESDEIPADIREKLPHLANAGKYDEALRLLRPYAEQGYPEAEFDMATGFVLKGNNADNNEIIVWVRKAAAQDYPQALGFLENAYQWGEYGLPTNSVMAAMWQSARTNENIIPKCLNYERDHIKVEY